MSREAMQELDKRITDYLLSGGLFNPELAIHDRVRDLLMDCRAALRAALGPVQPPSLLTDYITPELIDRCAQRLASWDDGCVWPDSWDSLQVAQMRKDAEKVLREGLCAIDRRVAAPPDGYVMVPAEPTEEMMMAGAQAIAENIRASFSVGVTKVIYNAMLSAAKGLSGG